MVMGGDSHFEGFGFESEHHILDGHFFTLTCCKHHNVYLKKTENKKSSRDSPFLTKEIFSLTLAIFALHSLDILDDSSHLNWSVAEGQRH